MSVTVTVITAGDTTHVIPADVFETILAAAEQHLSGWIRRHPTSPHNGRALRWILKLRGMESPMVG